MGGALGLGGLVSEAEGRPHIGRAQTANGTVRQARSGYRFRVMRRPTVVAATGNKVQERQEPDMSGQSPIHPHARRPIGPQGPPDASRVPARAGHPDEPEEWIAIEVAAAHLAIPVRTLYRLAQRSVVPAVKVGRTWRFKRSMLDRSLSDTAGSATSAVARPAPAPRRRPSGRSAARIQRGPVGEASIDTVTALADLTVDLSAMLEPDAIADYLSRRLRAIFSVDAAGLLRLDGDDLVMLVESAHLPFPAGTRFPVARTPILARALTAAWPMVVDDLRGTEGETFDGDPTRSYVVSRFGLTSAVFVPVQVSSGIWGLLALTTNRPRAFSRLELDRLQSVAGQVGLALTNARLFAETRRWSDQLERIEALGRRLNHSRDVAGVADAVANEIDSVLAWDGLRFYVLEPNSEVLEPIVLRAKVPYYADETPEATRLVLGQGLGGHIAQTRQAEIIPDVLHDPRMHDILGTEDVDESMLVLLLVQDDETLGVLELSRLGLAAFDADDLRLMQIVAAQAAVALLNARQVEELRRRSDALERRLASQRQLLAITERLLVTRERGAIFEAVADTLAGVVRHDTLTIYVVDRAAECLVPILARDRWAEEILATRPALGAGITGDVIQKGEAEIINDANNDPRVFQIPGTPADENECMIVAPIQSSDGVIGALNLYRTGGPFDTEDLELVRLFANHVAIALENAAVHDRLVEAARADPLTGLPNRRFFAERVEHALARRSRTGAAIGVLFLDLDEFKLVNDGLGHGVGDQVLVTVAERLRRSLRAADTVARLGGDEFGILLEDVHDRAEPIAAATRITETLREPIRLDHRLVSVRASIGVTIDAGEAASGDELLRNADTAMYRAKAGGRDGFALFEPSMHAAQLARLELDGELHEASANGEFQVRYQPIVELATGRMTGIEALLRWHHPTRGLIPPSEFIPIAEETGRIVPIGAWVLGEAVRTLRTWQLDGSVDSTVRLSVNTSVRQLTDGSFVHEVDRVLAETGLPAGCLILEITESLMLADESRAIGALGELRARGVHIAVDDFGTGYSSLGYLKRLPVDGLKIDRSFIDGLGVEREKTAIVTAALAFARALDLSVTAEGIETELQLQHLVELGCPLGQGYRFSPPLDRAGLLLLLATGVPFHVPAPLHAIATEGAAAQAAAVGKPAA